MATRRIPRPRDPIALAKLIGDIATGQVADAVEDGKNTGSVESGRRGGETRARATTPEQRQAIAKKAAATRNPTVTHLCG
jgi:ubiquinone biosynthesis protein UbiJ